MRLNPFLEAMKEIENEEFERRVWLKALKLKKAGGRGENIEENYKELRRLSDEYGHAGLSKSRGAEVITIRGMYLEALLRWPWEEVKNEKFKREVLRDMKENLGRDGHRHFYKEFFPKEYAEKKIKELERNSKKLPTRKLKLKEETEDFDELIKTGNAKKIYRAGVDWKQFNYEKGLDALIKIGEAGYICYAGEYWKQFDYEKGLDALIKVDNASYVYLAGKSWKQFDYEKGLNGLIKTGSASDVYHAGVGWKQFDYEKGLKFLKNNSEDWYQFALKHWPKGVKETKAEIERLERKSKKLPTKKLKLKEATEDFDKLIKTSNASYIWDAGLKWKKFNYEKGLDALIKIGKAQYIYYVGLEWKKFNYEKGSDALIKIGEANCIYSAGRDWKQFDYEKGINFLKNKSEEYYKLALKNWPKGVEGAKAEIERLERKSKKLPTKKLKLK